MLLIEEHGEKSYCIHEVHYDEDGSVMGWTQNAIAVELKTLHKKLQTDGDRIQRDIAEHAELSQQVMQLTKIISDSVKKLPCVYRKPKPAHNGDEVRQGSRVN